MLCILSIVTVIHHMLHIEIPTYLIQANKLNWNVALDGGKLKHLLTRVKTTTTSLDISLSRENEKLD